MFKAESELVPDQKRKQTSIGISVKNRYVISERGLVMYQSVVAGPNKERDLKIVSEFLNGRTKIDIACELGISGERVRQIIARALRRETESRFRDPFKRLSTRARNCLALERLNTVNRVRNACLQGRHCIPSAGPKTMMELTSWLSVLEAEARELEQDVIGSLIEGSMQIAFKSGKMLRVVGNSYLISSDTLGTLGPFIDWQSIRVEEFCKNPESAAQFIPVGNSGKYALALSIPVWDQRIADNDRA